MTAREVAVTFITQSVAAQVSQGYERPSDDVSEAAIVKAERAIAVLMSLARDE